MSPNFQPADEVLPRAEAILERERLRLRREGIQGELVLTGGSSLPRALTGGDIDLHLRVVPAAFGATVRALSGPYVVVHPEIWSGSLATFALPGETRVGVAVTPIGSVHDIRFRSAWQRLATDRRALEAYNSLKRAHAGGPEADYLSAKAGFFDAHAGGVAPTRPPGPSAAPQVPLRRNHARAFVLAGPPLLVMAGIVLMTFAPQRSGPLALVQILLPHLALACMVLVPIAVLRRIRVLGAALAVLVAVAAVRFGPEWVSLPADSASGAQVRLVTWNLERGGNSAASAVEGLLAHAADVVALQELTPDVAAALEDDARITHQYPHQLLAPDPGVAGMGLLSRHPIGSIEPLDGVAGFTARVALGTGAELTVVNAHPYPGRIDMAGGIPVSFDPSDRDAAIGRVRASVDAAVSAGETVAVIGDFNVVSTEPGYSLLTSGLRDAHAEVGSGTGWTWRPGMLELLPLGLLRLDYVLTSPDLRPLTARVHCGYPGDHCLVSATVSFSD